VDWLDRRYAYGMYCLINTISVLALPVSILCIYTDLTISHGHLDISLSDEVMG
jgi:hypothetical protein